MKKLFALTLVLLFAPLLENCTEAQAQTQQDPTVSTLADKFTNQTMRPCLHTAAGVWTVIDCSADVAYSAALHKWSHYVMQAKGGNPYFDFSVAGTGEDATSADGQLPNLSMYEFITGGNSVYITCDGSADASTVAYFECL